MLSGSSLDTWTLTRNPLSFAQSVTKNLNIPVTNTLEMILYLKRIPAELIQNATASQFYSVSSAKRRVILNTFFIKNSVVQKLLKNIRLTSNVHYKKHIKLLIWTANEYSLNNRKSMFSSAKIISGRKQP